MTKRRARLNDENDPLSSTDKVLAGFEQISQSTSKKANKSASQLSDVSTTQPESNLTSQQSDQTASQPSDTPTRKPSNHLTQKQVDMLASQQVNTAPLPSVEKQKLRKSTFQVSEAVLHELDKLHLTLQLELGKANAPYKEVIVEEALVRFLEEVSADRVALIEALVSRQKSRDNS